MASVFKRGRSGKNGRWTISYADASGRKRQRAGFADKAKSLELARKLEAEAAMVREGLMEPTDHSARMANLKPIAEHVEDYRLFLLAKGGTVKHASHVASTLCKLFDQASVSRLSDLSPDRLQGILHRLGAIRAARTTNHTASSCKSFLRWLVACGRIRVLPGWLSMLAPKNEAADRRRVRRVLTPAEIDRLLMATLDGPPYVVFGATKSKANAIEVSGLDRYTLYLVASETGLRANELASLTPRSFDFEAATVTVEAAYSKRRRRDVLPIRRAIVPELRAYLAGRDPEAPVWNLPSGGKAGPKLMKFLRRDLAAAGIPEVTPEGVIDFHSLRHSFISNLIARGVDPKTVQVLARHSTITLTVDRYSHTDEARKRAAIEGK